MSKKILIVDDDEDILSVLELILVAEGYEVILYNTGTTAERVEKLQPDLILLDIRIAGFEKTGVEICSELKAYAGLGKLPVLLISAEGRIDAMAQSCGADGYISKPFDLHEIIKKVEKILN